MFDFSTQGNLVILCLLFLPLTAEYNISSLAISKVVNISLQITASADNTLKLWDVNCLCKELSTLQGHQASIKSVDAHREEPSKIK